MSSSEQIVRRAAAETEPADICQERQKLLARLKQAFDDFSAAVRESRERGTSLSDDQTEAAGASCAQVWTELQGHQEKHGCWRRRE